MPSIDTILTAFSRLARKMIVKPSLGYIELLTECRMTLNDAAASFNVMRVWPVYPKDFMIIEPEERRCIQF